MLTSIFFSSPFQRSLLLGLLPLGVVCNRQPNLGAALKLCSLGSGFLMPFFFLMSFFPVIVLLSKSLPLQPLPPWAGEVRLLSILFWRELSAALLLLFDKFRPVSARKLAAPSSPTMSPRKRCAHRVDNVEESGEMSILDLPELALECILGKLSPAGLSNMAAVCSSLRETCRSDHLWEKHMEEKWGRVIGHAARREWKLLLASIKNSSASNSCRKWIGALSCVWPISWLKSRIDGGCHNRSPLPDDSIMSWYRSLESGGFWFPAQVYNREHGHVGFMLSCYDAEVRYDRQTNSFHARYPPHGRRTIVVEEGVQWDRLRAPPVNTPPHDLHISDCLSDLRPGNHIEIQWRRNKEFPYGWWYGVIGHLESCNGNEHYCSCHLSDTVVLEFNQYTLGSRWRRASISRKHHREEGNETDGFYGGIRKLHGKDEISKWRRLWPTDALE
ncbi:F-box protein At2g32560-like [Musa acuminata AAA Group]|uniref:F-box protein At2g32560 n=1 Tax=Musa acuminata AAA Group TaxID=214697 RepID=UPI0031D09DF8